MTKALKLFIKVFAGVGVLLVLLAALALILSRVLDTDSIGRSLAAELEVRYHIRSERVKISLLPSPRMTLFDVRTTLPDTFTASAEAVRILPRILPLLKGKLAPAEIELLSPMVSAILPEQEGDSAKSSSQRLLHLKDRTSQLQGTLLAALSGVVIDARNGELKLYSGQNRTFFFEDIDIKTSVHAQRVDFELTSGKSDLWQAFTFSGWVDVGTLRASAELNLTGGNPRDLARYLDTPLFKRIGDSRIELSLTLSADGPGNARADFNASVPQLSLGEGPQSTVMSNGTFGGTFTINANGVNFALSHFRFETPRIDLTANFDERYHDQSIALNIEGRETDAASVKSLLDAVDNGDPVVQKTFEIIRKAEVPAFTFSASAKSITDLLDSENFTVKGSIEDGVVFVPKPQLLISNVRGDVLIKDGVLEGTNVSGTTAGSSTSNATLRIGLPKDNSLFHLDLPLEADLSELPEVLQRVVESETFRQELARIKDVTGKARGRLVLGESLDSVESRVEAGPFQISGRYGRLPEPVDLEGPSFFLETKGSKVSVASLAGKSGKSSFESVDINYSWGEETFLQVESKARSVLSMELLGDCLRSNEYWKAYLEGSPKGLLVFDSFHFSGPPLDRSKRIFNASGLVEEVFFQNAQLNRSLTLKTGAFEVTGEELILKGLSTVMADSSLTVSGKITGYTEQPGKVELQMNGLLGPEGNKIAASLVGLPPSIRAISNLNLLSSHLTLEKEKTTFHGELQIPAGPKVRVDLIKTPQELSIEDLTIKDADSDAEISISTRQNLLKIGFSGILSNTTADRLLIDNKLLTGPVEGKFKASLYLDKPDKSTAQGKVKISGFQLPVDLPVPTRIENAVLDAEGNKINVQSAVISWDGTRLSLVGNIAITGGAYLVDMNAFADSLDLDSLIKCRGELANDSGRKCPLPSKKAWDVPIKGAIHVRSQQLSYGKFTWSPANADVVLSPGTIDVRLNQANLCGISTPGNIVVKPDGFDITLNPSAKDQDLESAITCFFHKQHILSGNYTLKGNLSAKGCNGSLADSLEGDVELKARDGRIFRLNTFTKLISLLSITEIYRGVVPDLVHEGCAYTTIESKGKIKNGKLILADSVVDGPSVKMVFRGEIDLIRKKVDVVALVTPLRTVERVVGATPIMGKLLGETFVTVPVSISGDLDDPSVVVLSPNAVGAEFFGFMKRVFHLPLAIFHPSHENEASENADASTEPNPAVGAAIP